MRCTPFALLLLATAASGQRLQNDSAAPGGEIAFYPRMQAEESFRVVLDAPPDLPDYRLCRLLVWIGPDDFNVFTVRVGHANDEGVEDALIWQSGLDAYQIFGSRNSLSSVDLRQHNVVTDADRLVVAFRHAEGFSGPPTVASDTDGITPRRNRISFLQRNGNWFDGFTEELPEDGNYPRPPGDWIVRADVVAPNGQCPQGDERPPDVDAGVPPPPLEPDAGEPEDAGVEDAAPRRDAGPRPDASPPRPDATPRDARVVDRGAGLDVGPRPGAFALSRIVPAAGPPDRNVDVVINGSGFPFGEDVTARLGDVRLLEADVRSDSTLTAIVPAGMDPGLYALSVTRADGQEAILPEAYRVVAPGELAVAAITPDAVLEGEAVDVEVRGVGFDATTTFALGPIPLDVVLVDDTRARGRLEGALVAGTYDVVARRGADEAVLPAAFTVRRPGGVASDDCDCDLAGRGPAPWGLLLLLGLWPLRRRRR
ncbi:MAG: IPT/TIG domain-containing protein [Myxococcales bacterium]|nr:IPT/TIG domain-containing protein [Myxococcales bacterium]